MSLHLRKLCTGSLVVRACYLCFACRLLFCLSCRCICLYLSFCIRYCLLICIVCRLIEVLGMILVSGHGSNVRLCCKSFSLSLSLFLCLTSLLLLYVCLTVCKELFLLVCLKVITVERGIVLACTLLRLSFCLFRLLFCLSSRCICLYLSFCIRYCLLICIVCRLIEVLGMILVSGHGSNVRLCCKSFSLSLSLFLCLASLLLLYVCLTVCTKITLLLCLKVIVISSCIVLISDLCSLSFRLFSLALSLSCRGISLGLSLSLCLSSAFSVISLLVEASVVICIVFSSYLRELLVTGRYTDRYKYGLGSLG